jgi:hypothetical protein
MRLDLGSRSRHSRHSNQRSGMAAVIFDRPTRRRGWETEIGEGRGID